MIKLNGREIVFNKFPNGEVSLTKAVIVNAINAVSVGTTINNIDIFFQDDKDLIHLMMLKDAITTHAAVNMYNHMFNTLRIKYMPYSRMDRDNSDYFFTLKTVASFINSLKFDRVIVYDAHSDVTAALLNNCTTRDNVVTHLFNCLSHVGFNRDTDYIMFPDAGAQKRYSKLIEDKMNILVGFKDRDFKTGVIKKLHISGIPEGSLNSNKVVIVDDLCSAGGTFHQCALKLKTHKAGDIHMVVGHCEDKVFDGPLFNSDLIGNIYTTDSMIRRQKHPRIINMEEL